MDFLVCAIYVYTHFIFRQILIFTFLPDFVFSTGIMIREATRLQSENNGSESDFESLSFYVIFVSLQAVTITQQGFLNGMIYSWTRGDTFHIISFSRSGLGSHGDLELPGDSSATKDGDSVEESATVHDWENETSRSLSVSPAPSRKTFSQYHHT